MAKLEALSTIIYPPERFGSVVESLPGLAQV